MPKSEDFLQELVENKLEFPEIEELKSKYAPYLKEIRKRVLFVVVFFVISTISGFIFYEDIIKLMVGSLSLHSMNVVFTSPFQYFNLAISSGFTTGVVFIIPITIVQILSFLRPALKNSEFNTVVRFIPFSFLLFFLGFIFGIYMMRWQIGVFVGKSASLGIGTILDIVSLLSTILLTAAFLGLAFQFPIVILLLMRIGVLDQKAVSKQRGWVYLGSFIFTLFLPAESILVDLILTIPLVGLFELTLFLNYILERKKKKRNKQKHKD